MISDEVSQSFIEWEAFDRPYLGFADIKDLHQIKQFRDIWMIQYLEIHPRVAAEVKAALAFEEVDAAVEPRWKKCVHLRQKKMVSHRKNNQNVR